MALTWEPWPARLTVVARGSIEDHRKHWLGIGRCDGFGSSVARPNGCNRKSPGQVIGGARTQTLLWKLIL